MSNTDKILLGVLTIVICGALVLGSVLKKPSVVVLNSATEEGQKVLGYAEGTHLNTFTVEYLEATTELKAVSATFTGDSRLSSLVETGSVASFTTTSAVTAAQLCNSGALVITSAEILPTVTLPATTTLFADCMTTNGDSLIIPVLNGSSVTTTVIAAGTGGTLLVSSSTTIGVSDGAVLQVVRDTASTYKALLLNAL